MTILRKTVTVFFAVITVIGISATILLTVLTLTGNYNISSLNNSSMQPTIHNGSWVLSHKIDSNDITEGDIVVIPGANSTSLTVLGRVITKIDGGNNDYYYQLKGDGEILPDPWSYKVGNESYKVVFTLPVLGLLANPVIITVTTIFIIALGLFYLIYLHKPKEKIIEETVNTGEHETWTAVDEIESLFDKVGTK